MIGPVIGLLILGPFAGTSRRAPVGSSCTAEEEDAEKKHRAVSRKQVRECGSPKLKDVADMTRPIEIDPAEAATATSALAKRLLFKEYPGRAILGQPLIDQQSFLYNSIFFTYTLVLTNFYGVDAKQAPLYLVAFAIGNLAGPFMIGHLSTPSAARR